MSRIDGYFKILSHERTGRDIMELVVNAPEIAPMAKPGQFCMLEVSESTNDPLLRRPLSIFRVEKDNVAFLYRIVGRGTSLLSSMEKGEHVGVLGPLGTFFSFSGYEKIILAGGGLGIAPLFFLCQRIAQDVQRIEIFLGGRGSGDIPVAHRFKEIVPHAKVVTEDGSAGIKGLVTRPLKELLDRDGKLSERTAVAACGPWPMMRAVHEIAKGHNVDCQVSLETHMACGAGLCLGCAVPASAGGYLHVCKEGPVTDSRKIIWDRP